MHDDAQKTFRTVARSHSGSIFRQGESLRVDVNVEDRVLHMVFRTRYIDRGFDILAPGDMWLQVDGKAESTTESLGEFTNRGRDIVDLIVVLMNTAAHPLEGELSFETTPGSASRDFFQRYVESDRPALRSRFIDPLAVGRVLELISDHEELDAIGRAAAQYSIALNGLKMGSEIPTLAHLFMAAEALKSAMWRNLLRKSGEKPEELAVSWGYRTGGKMTLREYLDSASRGILVFNGDKGFHDRVRSISDAFEHGFRSNGSLFAEAGECLIPTFAAIRSALLELMGVSDTDLLNDFLAFAEPRGLGPREGYITAKMVGDAACLGEEGNEYPHFVWEEDLKNLTYVPEEDKMRFKVEVKLRPSTPSGLQFLDPRIELWDGGVFQ